MGKAQRRPGQRGGAAAITANEINPQDSTAFAEIKPAGAYKLATFALKSFGWAADAYAKHPEFRDHLQALVSHAVAVQGRRALEMPKSAAAIHEAGHAVVYALEGDPPNRVRIKRVVGADGARAWLGLTTCASDAWRVGPDTDPRADLKQARVTLAGWGAEFLFEPLRLASSMDECILAGHMCKWAASKLGRPPEDVLGEQDGFVLGALKKRERHVRAVASALIRHTILRGAQLAKLLPPARIAP